MQTIKSEIAIIDNCAFSDKEKEAWKFLKSKLENYDYIINTINRISGFNVLICEDLIAIKQKVKI